MFTSGLYLTITKPSRITSHSATIIDNIFTNTLESNIVSGLLVNDITDHLPVFAILDCDPKIKQEITTNYVRVRTEDTMNAFRAVLSSHDGKMSLRQLMLMGHFIETFLMIYNKNCRVRQNKTKNMYMSKPWLTKGLINACKKELIVKRIHYT